MHPEDDTPSGGVVADDSRDWVSLVFGVPGVANVEVDLRDDGRPRLRVWLDGSLPADDVSVLVEEAISNKMPPDTTAAPNRSGLGRGLKDLLDETDESAIPALLPRAEPTLLLVAVEETAGGVSVRAADSAGGVAFSPVSDPRSLNQAVVSAVARLRRERPAPRLGGVELRDVDGVPILTVVLSRADGQRLVGASMVEAGMPFSLGRAVWEALATVDRV